MGTRVDLETTKGTVQVELDDEGRATRYVEWWMEPRRGAAEA